MTNNFSSVLFALLLMLLTGCSHQAASTNTNTQTPNNWAVPEEEAQILNPIQYNVASVSAGKALFEDHCQSCHGYYAEGTGIVGATLDKKPANLLRLSGKQAEGAFAWKIAEGRGDMPAFKALLTKQEIWQVVNFIASLENEAGSLGDANYE